MSLLPTLASARVSTRHISTTGGDYPACDVCGRTLLRGEHISTYMNGGARRSVCELCETHALHEGWVSQSSHTERRAPPFMYVEMCSPRNSVRPQTSHAG